ncbi:MAG: phosphatidate cytidylyltransferase [Firmicutes bacterium]|nr:phosphatidate cytidylyltransferase [Bacillota bacterium]
MKTRIISGVLMMPLLLFVWYGKTPLFCLCLALALIGLHEFFKGLAVMGRRPASWIGYASVVALYAITYLFLFVKVLSAESYALAMNLWLFATVAAALFVSLFRKDHDVFDGPLAALAALYIGYFSIHIVLTSENTSWIWLVFLSAFGTDTMAYFTGYFLGKHKLCPNLSPKKTVEGAVGGVLGSMLLCLLYGLLFEPSGAVYCAAAGLFASPFAQAGDLIASAFKRKMGIKDYGKLIPGHGGVMDRIDSVLLTAPVIYYVYSVFFTLLAG